MRARVCVQTMHPRRSSALLSVLLSDAVRAVTSGIKRPCPLPPGDESLKAASYVGVR